MPDKDDLKNIVIGTVIGLTINIAMEETGLEDWIRTQIRQVVTNGRNNRRSR